MIGFEDQKKMFELIGKTLEGKMECLVVGGSAMLFYNFSKAVTKDVDLVLFSEKDREKLSDALREIGFEEFASPKSEGEPSRLRLKDTVFDLFVNTLFRILVSKNMLGRVKERVEFGNLALLVASPEDIILSKSMTDRKGDREDAAGIIKEVNVDWKSVIDECEWQSGNNPNVAFGVYLFDFLEDLVHEQRVQIPREIIKRITRIYERRLERLSGKSRP